MRLVRLLGFVLLGIALLVVIGVAVLHTAPARRYILGRIVSIAQGSGIALDASSLEYGLLRPSVELRHVRIAAGKSGLPPLLEADRLFARLALLPLLHGVIRVTDGSLDRPTLRLAFDSAGESNIPANKNKPAAQPANPSASLQDISSHFQIGHFEIRDGALSFRHDPAQIEVRLPLWKATIGDSGTRTTSVDFETQQPGEAAASGRLIPIDSLRVRARLGLEGETLKVEMARLESAGSDISVQGSAADLESPHLSATADAHVALAHAAQLLLVGETASGELNAHIEVDGALDALHAQFKLNGGSDQLRFRKFTADRFSASGAYDSAAQEVVLDMLDLGVSNGGVEAQGKLSLAGRESSVRAQVSNVNLEALAQSLDLKFQIASRATGTVSASWPGMEFRQADGRALMRFAKIRPQPEEGSLPLAGEVEALIDKGRVTLFLGQRPSTAGRPAALPGARVRPAHSLENSRRKLRGHAIFIPAVYHPGSVSPTFLAVSASPPEKPLPTVPAWLRRFLLSGALGQSESQTGAPATPMNAVEALASILTGQVTVTPSGGLSGRLSAHIKDVGELVSNLNALTGGGVPVKAELHGEADVTANLSGDTEAPVVEVRTTTQSVQVGRLQGVSADVTAVYSPAQLTIKGATIQQQDQMVEAHGVMALAGNGPMDLEARVTDLRVATVLDSIGRADLPVAGTLSLNGNVKGTRQQPEATVTAMASNLKAFGESWGNVNIDASMDGQQIQIRRLDLHKTIGPETEPKDAGDLTATGTYDLRSKDYAIDLKASDLRIQQVATSGHAISGVINADAKGQGNIDRPMLSADVAVSDFLFDMQDPAKQLNGNLKANLNVSGEMREPRGMDLELRADEINLTGNGFDLRALDPIRASYKGQVLGVESAQLSINGGKITIGGSLPLDSGGQAGDMRLMAALDLRSGYRLAPFLEQSDAMGALDIDLDVRGSLKHPAPEGTLTLRDVSLNPPALHSPIEQLQTTVSFKDQQILLQDASASWAGASITGKGAVPLAVLAPSLATANRSADSPPSAQLTLDVKGVQLANLLKNSGDVNAAGAISLHLEASAPALKPELLTANLRFDELNATLGGLEIVQQGKSSISVAKGTVTIDQFQLIGPETKIEASGTAQVTGVRNLNARLTANTNASLASLFFQGGQVAGLTSVKLQANGTLSNPDIRGFASVQDGHFAIESPNVAATNLNLRIDFAGNRFDIRDSTGNLNGGDLRVGGGGSWQGGGLRDTNVTISGKDVYFEFPEGLLTSSSFDLNLQSSNDLLVVSGKATVQDGTFRRNINVQASVINLLQSGNSGLDLSSERSEFLSRVRYNVGLETPSSPIVVDNNLGKFSVLTNVRLVGSYYQPSLIGRVQLSEAGELYLNGHTFYIQRGSATFVSEQQIRPEVDVLAQTTAAGYDITMAVTGPAGKITTTLTSDPPLPESDIVSVLLVGRPLKDVRNAEAEVASQQLLSYVAGGLGSALSSQLQQVFGLSQVRLEPVAVAGETTPDARLTLGQNLTSDLTLTYSRSVIKSGDDIWIGQYNALRSLIARITKQSDNSYRFDLNNDWQFGGTPLVKKGKMLDKKKVAAVRFTGMSTLSDKELGDKLKVRMGDDFDFFKLRKGVDRIQNSLQDQGHLEAQARLKTATQDIQTDVDVDVEAGPTVTFTFEGYQPSRGLRGSVRDIWRKGVFDLQRADQAVDATREELAHNGFLEAKVTDRIETPTPGEKHVIIHVEVGQRFEDATLKFLGAMQIEPDELSKALSDAKLRDRVLIEPSKVRSLLQRYYADQGYLGAQVDLPRVRTDGTLGSIDIAINEGPLYHFQSILAEGNQAYSVPEIATAAEIEDGSIYMPATLQKAVANVQKLYTDHGYNDVVVTYDLRKDDVTASVQLSFRVEEGKQQVVRQIVVDGNRETSEKMILEQVRVQPGQVLTTPAISRVRSNVYSTGAYQLVDLMHVVPDDPFASAPLAPNQAPVDLDVIVHEIQPYRVMAGGYYDTDRGPGAIMDVSNRNSLGSAKVLGLRARYDANLQEARLYFSQPFLRRFPVRSLGETYFTREVRDAFIADHLGVSFGQEARLGNRYILNYGYRIERAQIFNLTDAPLSSTDNTVRTGGATDTNTILTDTNPLPPFGSLSRRLAPLTVTISRDTRDDVLNSTRGQFVSHGFAIGFNFLGSQDQYLKYFVQYFRYIPLSKPAPVPFRPNLKKPRFSYAGGVRVGLGRGLAGQDLIQSERFFAGGGTTIRGFKQDEVGPLNPSGVPVGGDALLILNNEVRLPVWSFIGAAAFVDVGNVYPHIQDFNPFKIRAATGLGLRLTTPWVLIRADYGVKVGRRAGESSGAFFVSIGQAF